MLSNTNVRARMPLVAGLSAGAAVKKTWLLVLPKVLLEPVAPDWKRSVLPPLKAPEA